MEELEIFIKGILDFLNDWRYINMKYSKYLVILLMLILITLPFADAHPGRTDSKGGHYCRTNCASWGLEDGEYHYHNSGSTPTPTETSTIAVTPTATAIPIQTAAIIPTVIIGASRDRYVKVEKIVDGDTVWVDYEERVRLVGINTPELGQPGSIEAKEYVIDRIMNKKIYLDVDDKKPKDKYGRTLAVVLIDGDNLNKELLCKNYAEVMYIPPSEFNPDDWKSSCPSIINTTTIATPEYTIPTITISPDNPQLEQNIRELGERLNKTEEKQNQQENRISWLESMIYSILKQFGLI